MIFVIPSPFFPAKNGGAKLEAKGKETKTTLKPQNLYFWPRNEPKKYWCWKGMPKDAENDVKGMEAILLTTCARFRQHDVHVILGNPFCSVFAVWRGKHNFWWPSTAFFFRGRRSVWLTYRSIFHGGHNVWWTPSSMFSGRHREFVAPQVAEFSSWSYCSYWLTAPFSLGNRKNLQYGSWNLFWGCPQLPIDDQLWDSKVIKTL